MSWRIDPLARGCGIDLLAGTDAMFDGLTDDPRPALRWYRPTDATLVVGRAQARHLDAVVRPSGGGAVWLDADLLCVDVAVPAGDPLLEGDVASVFDPIGRAWHAGLRALGLQDGAVWAGPLTALPRGDADQRIRAAICYATLGRGEVTVGGRKLVGLAQRRRRHGALVQCGMLLRWRPAPLLAALGIDHRRAASAGVLTAAVGLEDALAPRPADDAIVEAVSAHLTGRVTA